MTIFPNPVLRSEILQIKLDNAFAGLISIRLRNENGETVHLIKIVKSQAVLELKVPLQEFARGMYNLTAENNGLYTTQKINIQ